MKRKTTLKLTPAQKATVLGDPAPAELATNVALAKAERASAVGCFDQARPVAVKIGPLVTEITWRSVKDELPDDGIDVLIAIAGEAEAEAAFRTDGRWMYFDSHIAKHVYAWAHMPATPRAGRGKKGGAS